MKMTFNCVIVATRNNMDFHGYGCKSCVFIMFAHGCEKQTQFFLCLKIEITYRVWRSVAVVNFEYTMCYKCNVNPFHIKE